MVSSNQSAPNLLALIRQYDELTQTISNFADYNQLVHSFHSVAIEGGTLTWEETQTWLEKDIRVADKPLDHHLMLVDHQLAWQQMMTWATTREPLNRVRLQTLTAMLMRQKGGLTNAILSSFDSSLGEFRTVSAMAGSHIFMDAKKVPAAVDTLLKLPWHRLKRFVRSTISAFRLIII